MMFTVEVETRLLTIGQEYTTAEEAVAAARQFLNKGAERVTITGPGGQVFMPSEFDQLLQAETKSNRSQRC